MPTTLSSGPYRFYFYAYDCVERFDTHVDRDNLSAKFWLEPNIRIMQNHGYSRKELREIERIIQENMEILKDEWDIYCSGHISARKSR